MLVEATVLLAASRHNGTNVLRDAATLYKIDTDAIASKVKQEFAAKARANKETKTQVKPGKAKLLRACSYIDHLFARMQRLNTYEAKTNIMTRIGSNLSHVLSPPFSCE